MTDAELILAMQSGDEAALADFYDRYLPSVWRYARARIFGGVQTVEDVVAETFVAAIQSVARLQADGRPLAAWVMGIARHKVADHRRRMVRQFAPLHGDDTLDDAQGPYQRLEQCERRAAVADTLEQMRDEERQVLEWKYIEGLSVREIGQRLGRTEKGAEALLYRSRLTFKAALERNYFQSEEVA
jgi:RNA polymerase sigma-70 factor (ECF subfamily)